MSSAADAGHDHSRVRRRRGAAAADDGYPGARPRAGSDRCRVRGSQFRRGPLPAGHGRRTAAVRPRDRGVRPYPRTGPRGDRPVGRTAGGRTHHRRQRRICRGRSHGSGSGGAAGRAGSSLETAAAVPSNSTTAFLVLDRVARIEPGESVLVHAAAGGVGSQLGQAARLLGAGRVVGTVGSTPRSRRPPPSATTR